MERGPEQLVLCAWLHAGNADVSAERDRCDSPGHVLRLEAQRRSGKADHELVHLHAERPRREEVPAFVQDNKNGECKDSPEYDVDTPESSAHPVSLPSSQS
jgi:hypothetical protein